jgi:3-oxoacyl-[acyl-carrier protein] reductase
MVTNDIRLSQTVIDEITSRTPLGRIGQPDDMAGVAIMLLSDAAKFVNGEIVEVNGGFFFD